MFDERTSRRVGGIMLVAVAIAMSAVLTVDCGRFRSSIEVTVYFAHPGALVEGADVQVAGRVIGQVRAVELIPVRAASAPDHPLYPTGGVAVHLAVRTRYAGWASPDGQFFVTAKGLLGESYLEIGPPVGDAAPSRGLRDGDRVRGIDPARLDLVLVRSFENTAAFRRLLDDLGPSAGELRTALDGLAATLDALEPSPGAYHDLAESVARATDQAHGLAERLRASGADWGQLAAVAANAAATADRLAGELGRIRAGIDAFAADLERIRGQLPTDLADRLDLAVARTRAALATFERSRASLAVLTRDLADGRGTVGALLHDPEFIDDAKQLGKTLKRQPWRIFGHGAKPPAEGWQPAGTWQPTER